MTSEKAFSRALKVFSNAGVLVSGDTLLAALDAAAAVDGDAGWNEAGIYVASKTRHADMWRRYRDDGAPIISTWIDEAGEGESACLTDLWRRCIEEASRASALVLYCAEGDVLKGAWVELGAALASGKPVFAVGIEQFTVANHSGITHCATVDEALAATRSLKRLK